jgi:hypothetical protein
MRISSTLVVKYVAYPEGLRDPLLQILNLELKDAHAHLCVRLPVYHYLDAQVQQLHSPTLKLTYQYIYMKSSGAVSCCRFRLSFSIEK